MKQTATKVKEGARTFWVSYMCRDENGGVWIRHAKYPIPRAKRCVTTSLIIIEGKPRFMGPIFVPATCRHLSLGAATMIEPRENVYDPDIIEPPVFTWMTDEQREEFEEWFEKYTESWEAIVSRHEADLSDERAKAECEFDGLCEYGIKHGDRCLTNIFTEFMRMQRRYHRLREAAKAVKLVLQSKFLNASTVMMVSRQCGKTMSVLDAFDEMSRQVKAANRLLSTIPGMPNYENGREYINLLMAAINRETRECKHRHNRLYRQLLHGIQKLEVASEEKNENQHNE